MSASIPTSPQPAITSPYDVAEHLRTPEEIAAYLEAWLEDAAEDVPGVTRALRDVARAKDMNHDARDVSLCRKGTHHPPSTDASGLF